MRTYFKTNENFENAIKRFQIYGFSVEKKRVTCACGESAGAFVYEDGFNKTLKTAKVIVKCECCYNDAKIIERGE